MKTPILTSLKVFKRKKIPDNESGCGPFLTRSGSGVLAFDSVSWKTPILTPHKVFKQD